MSDSQSQAARSGLIAASIDIEMKLNSINNRGLRAVNAVITAGSGLRAGGGRVFLNNRNEVDRSRAADGVVAANAYMKNSGGNIRN